MIFDETFNNIAFKMAQQHTFLNPIEHRYAAAVVKTAVQGVITLKTNEVLDLLFAVDFKQERVTQFTPYFKTETDLKEFSSEFKKSVSVQLLHTFNKWVNQGISLPVTAFQKNPVFT